jgi:hypothetical protein
MFMDFYCWMKKEESKSRNDPDNLPIYLLYERSMSVTNKIKYSVSNWDVLLCVISITSYTVIIEEYCTAKNEIKFSFLDTTTFILFIHF